MRLLRQVIGILLWALTLQVVAWLVSVEVTWRVLTVVASMGLITQLINIFVEGEK